MIIMFVQLDDLCFYDHILRSAILYQEYYALLLLQVGTDK